MRDLIRDPFVVSAVGTLALMFLVAVAMWARFGLTLISDLTRAATAAEAPTSVKDDGELDRELESTLAISIAWRRVTAHRFVAESGDIAVSAPVEELISAEDLLAGTKWYRFFSGMPNYLVGVGLALTFFGLVLALQSIDARNLGDPGQLTRLFAAMKFKFIASMTGIILSITASVIQRVFQGQLHHAIGALQAAVSRRYRLLDPAVSALEKLSRRVESVEARLVESRSIAARTATATERSLDVWGNVVEQLNTAATQLKKFNDELSISIGNVLEQRFEQKLLPPLHDALKSLERAVLEVRDVRTTTDTDMMTGVVTEFRKALTGGTSNEVAAITSTLSQLNESLATTRTDLLGVGKTIESNIVAGLRGATGQLTESVEVLSRKLAETVNSASGSLTSRLDTATADAGHRFTNAVDRLDSLLSQARGTVDAGHNSAQTTERILERFADLAGKLEAAQAGLGRIHDPIQRATERLDVVAVQVRQASEAIERSTERTQQIEERVTSSWTQAGQRFEAVDRDLASIFTNLNHGLEAYAATVNDFNGKLTTEFTKALARCASAPVEGWTLRRMSRAMCWPRLTQAST